MLYSARKIPLHLPPPPQSFILIILPIHVQSLNETFNAPQFPNHLTCRHLHPPRKAMTFPSPTTLHHQTTVHFSTTFISTLTKLFSQRDYHHVSCFIDCLKQGKPKPKPDCMFIHFLIFLLHLVTFFIHILNQNSTSCHLCFLKFSNSNLG